MTRGNELMLDLASHFENLSGIAHDEWMRDKVVTLEEIESLFPMCSLLLEGYAKSGPANKARILKIMAEEIAV